tara:strand:- start:152 stop:589 length:438 start_codon:yes stop_codon:yes gene_type:complete
MEKFKKILKIVGITVVSLFAFLVILVVAFPSDSVATENASEDKASPVKQKQKESTPSERAPIRFSSSQAEQFMQNLCLDLNQTLMRKKTIYVDDRKVYMFMSVAENGMTCVSTVSEIKLEVMSSDCGDTQTKINQWNAIQDGARI